MSHHKIIIGRTEFISFPELFMDSIPAKTDTGAYRSAIHAKDVRVVEKNGKNFLSFNLLKDHIGAPYSREVKTDKYKKVVVENSFGVEEERYAVNLKVKVGPRVFTTVFTLADRSKKTYPVLLGRTMTNKRFIIDSSLTNIDRRKLKPLKITLEEDLEVLDP